MPNGKRTIAWILAAGALLVMLSSVFVLSKERNHCCEGENCPICAVLSVAEENLKKEMAVLFPSALLAVFSAFVLLGTEALSSARTLFTLVTFKVKLSN